MRNYLYFMLLPGLIACRQVPQGEYTEYSGETMGTYYRITCGPGAGQPDQETIERWLSELNKALSTYDPGSVISLFNQSENGIGERSIGNARLSRYFFDKVTISSELFHKSGGSFDPTVMPLVNYWGFGYDQQKIINQIDTHRVDSLRKFVGFEKLNPVSNGQDSIHKSDSRVQLDFSAVAKGYAIDILGQFLEDSFSIRNYLIDIGGESRAKGVNREGNPWRVGINQPFENSLFNSFQFIVQLKDRSIATSGNYRNFYEVNGQKISHTINPKTGFFERNDLLSASIVANDCAVADGFATACMAKGYEGARKLVESSDDLEALLIYVDSDNELKHYITPRLSKFVTPSK
jgi:FAD:protein FMN transferase